MKILAIVFTQRRKDKPASLQVTEELCRLVSERGGRDTETEIVTMSELPVLACAGCKTCFREGRCPADEADGMAELRKKVQECDALIAATPVYMCMVSGWCKNFLDRCARWCHVFELLGKPCLVLSVTSATGGERTADYLSECLEVMGAAVSARLAFQKLGEGVLIGTETAKACMENAAAALFDAIRAPEDYLSERAETQFQSLQRTYRTLETVWLLSGQKCSSEVDTFRSRGLMTCASLREALHAGEAGGKP